MIIYVTRHGQTDYNREDRILGTTDVGLNEIGIRQAHGLADEMKKSNIIPDVIVSSPMRRTIQTAEIISETLNISEIIKYPELREWNYGRYEGLHRQAEGFQEGKSEFGVRMGETGESLLQLSHRVYSAMDRIISEYPGKKVLAVTHGGVCRIIETYFNNMTTEQFNNWFMGNCRLIEYNIDEEK